MNNAGLSLHWEKGRGQAPDASFTAKTGCYNSSVHFYLSSVISRFHLQELLCQCHRHSVEQKLPHFTPVQSNRRNGFMSHMGNNTQLPMHSASTNSPSFLLNLFSHPPSNVSVPRAVSLQISTRRGRRGTPPISTAGFVLLQGQRGQPQHGAKPAFSPWHQVQQSLEAAIWQNTRGRREDLEQQIRTLLSVAL